MKTPVPGRMLSALLSAALVLGASSCAHPYRPPETGLATDVDQGPWTFGGVDGAELTTEHYRLYTTSDNRSLRVHLPAFLESAHRCYLELTGLAELGASPDKNIVYLLADRQQWSAMTERLTGPMSQLYLSVESGGYCFAGRCVLWDLGHYATFSVAGHEGLHQFLQRRCRDGLPAWAEEGLCTQMEGFVQTARSVRADTGRNVIRQEDLRKAIASDRWLGVPDLLTTDPGEQLKGKSLTVPEYYGQVWALIQYLRAVPGYRGGLRRMLRDAEAGELVAQASRLCARTQAGRLCYLAPPPLPPEARTGREFRKAVALPTFKRYIDSDLTDFEKRFGAYARKLAGLE